MNVFTTREISGKAPLTVAEVRAFANAVDVGEIIPIIYNRKIRTSNTSFYEAPEKADVTVLEKYKYLVKTDYGIITWNDFVTGYHRYPVLERILTKKEKIAA